MRKTGLLLLLGTLGLLLPSQTGSASDNRGNEEEIVRQFYEAAINQKDFAAAEKFLGPEYIQHNQRAADGKEGLRAFIAFLRAKYPAAHSEIRKAFVDGDFVILHVHSVREPGTRGAAVVDIFRLDKGRIVEHWDVLQVVPSQAANGNTMF